METGCRNAETEDWLRTCRIVYAEAALFHVKHVHFPYAESRQGKGEGEKIFLYFERKARPLPKSWASGYNRENPRPPRISGEG